MDPHGESLERTVSRRPSQAAGETSRRFLAQWLFALLIVAVGLPTLARAQSRQQLERLVALAKVYDESKATAQWDVAAKAGEEMLAIVRANGLPKAIELGVMDQNALARLNLGDFDEALVLYRKVVEGCRAMGRSDAAEFVRLQNVMFNGLTGLGRVYRSRDQQEEAAKYFQQAIDYANKNRMPVEAAQATTDLAFSLTEMRREEEAIASLLKVLPALKQSADRRRKFDGNNSSYANALHCLGFTYDNLGRYDLGEPYHLEALEVILSNVGLKHNFTATVVDSLANSYQMQGRVAEAEAYYREEIKIYDATTGIEHPRCATVLNNLARLLEVDRGKHAEADKMAREALRIKHLFYEDDSPEVAVSMVNLANILWYQERTAEAEKFASAALEIYKKSYGLDHPETARCLQLLSTCRMQGGDNVGALKLLDEALAANEKRPFPPQQAAMLFACKAVVLEQLERRDEAAATMAEALKLLEIQRTFAAGVERERADVFAEFAVFYDLAIGHQAETNNVAEMFAITERMKARAFLDELQTQHVDMLAGLPEAERRELKEAEDQLRRRLSEAMAALDALPALGDKPTDEQKQAHEAAVDAVLDARSALYVHVTKVKSASKTYRQLITNQAETATLAGLQAILDEGELVLSYTVGDDASYVIIVERDTARFEELKLDQAMAELFEVEPGALTRDKLNVMLMQENGGVLPALSTSKSSPEAFLPKLAALWKLLVPEAERAALTGDQVKLLTILPTDALSLLPFEALVLPGEELEFLLDVGPPVVYAPSASVLLNLARRETTVEESSTPVFTLGDPAYPQPGDAKDRTGRAAGTSSAQRAALSRLPFSGWEANWVRDHFAKAGLQSTLVTGAAATEAAVRDNVSGRQIIHLACHGGAEQSYSNFFGALHVMPGRPGSPADDGTLSMSEIYGLDLGACELTILSACQTNYGPEQRGEGVWALSRGFLVAGARRVMASNWVINDRAGATLVSHFVSYLCSEAEDPSKFDYARALQQAKRAVRKEPSWQHPFYWSSLVLVGPK